MKKRNKLFSNAVADLVANDSITNVNIENVASALVKVETEAYKADYADITFTDLFDTINLNDRTATSFGYYYVTEAGKAQLSNTGGKISWVDSMVEMKQAPLFDGNVGYKYTLKELERVGALGTNLDSLKVETAIQATLELAQEIAYYGDAKRGITGFYNNPDVPSVSTKAGVDGNTWDLKTPKEKLADINYLFATAHKTTAKKEFTPNSKYNKLILSVEKWSDISMTTISDESDITILEFLANKCPYLTSKESIISSIEIADDTIRIYQKEKRKVAFYWGHLVNFKAPQADDLSFKVPADFSIGGLVLRKPLSCWDMEGI